VIRSGAWREGRAWQAPRGSGETPDEEESLVTVPAHAAPVAVPDLEAAMNAVRDHGLRLSSARRIVLEALFRAGVPLAAEEIAGGARGRVPACDLASVYRNLEALEAAGVVRHMHVGHGPGLYAPAGAAPELVVCERCGARAGVDPRVAAGVRAAVRDATGFAPRFDHFPLAGLCPRCADLQEEHDVRSR
jgi:Fur family transcriptional regulator, ferric uptake regulator